VIASWVGTEIVAARTTNEFQANEIIKHEARLTYSERTLDRIEIKLDKVLQHVPIAP